MTPKPDNIHYLSNPQTGIELIFCSNSAISYPLHNHVSVLTIGIILDGSMILTTSQGPKIYGKNQAFLISPYDPHSISAWETYTLLSLCINKNITKQYPPDIIRSNIEALLINAPCIKEINPYQKRQIWNLISWDTVFSALTACLSGRPGSLHPFIRRLKNHLELYPECKFSIEEMAQDAFLSKYHFIRSFKAEVGLTPHQFQIQNRIRKAKRLMHETKSSRRR